MSTAALPRISLVTPSLNQGRFLERTLRSVLDQGYPDLEYIVIDGGSTDQSVDIITRYADRLAYWVSEPDGGHANALNKGFAHATGQVMGWINSDDVLTDSSLWTVGQIFNELGDQVHWLTGLSAGMREDGVVIGVGGPRSYHRTLLRLGMYEGRKFGWVQQEGTFWSRALWERAGGRMDESLRAMADFELWSRFSGLATLHTVPVVLGIFRHHPEQGGQVIKPDVIWGIIDGVQQGLPHRWLSRLVPVQPLRWLERQGLRLSNDFVHYDFHEQGWVVRP